MAKTYRDLQVWQRAIDLAESVYILSRSMPSDERFALSDQIRRAASSIPANIAEGSGRQSRKEFLQFLSIARGSLCELETHLILAVRLKYIPRERTVDIWKLCVRVGQMLTRMRQNLQPTASDPPIRRIKSTQPTIDDKR